MGWASTPLLKIRTAITRDLRERLIYAQDRHGHSFIPCIVFRCAKLSELRVRDGSLPGELMSADMTIRMPYKIALAVTAALLTAIGGGYAANKAGSSGEQERVASLETRMNEQQAQIEGLKGDVRETRANTVQILLLLGNRHDN